MPGRDLDRWKVPPRPSQVVLLAGLVIAGYGAARLNLGIVAVGLFVALCAAIFGRMRGKFEFGGGTLPGNGELPVLKGELDDPAEDAKRQQASLPPTDRSEAQPQPGPSAPGTEPDSGSPR